jgi:hypothetical protein
MIVQKGGLMESSAIRAYKILERHAFSPEEAEEMAEIMTTSRDEHLEKWVASKKDIAGLDVKIAGLDVKIASVRTELKEDLANAKIDLIKWLVGTAIALVGIVFAMMKLMQ